MFYTNSKPFVKLFGSNDNCFFLIWNSKHHILSHRFCNIIKQENNSFLIISSDSVKILIPRNICSKYYLSWKWKQCYVVIESDNINFHFPKILCGSNYNISIFYYVFFSFSSLLFHFFCVCEANNFILNLIFKSIKRFDALSIIWINIRILIYNAVMNWNIFHINEKIIQICCFNFSNFTSGI